MYMASLPVIKYNMKGFSNVLIYTQDKGIIRTCVAVENGKIAEIANNLQLDEIYDIPADTIVTAGFIDEHIHGSDGSDGMDGNINAIKKVANGLAKEGTTAFLVSTMTQSKANIKRALNAVNEYIAGDFEYGARVLGVHLEGPFISEKYIGAQPLEYVIPPNIDDFKEFERASGDNIKMVTLAVEKDAKNLIEYLKSKKIVVSVGHSNAGYEDIEKAIKMGLRCVTHTYNAQSPLHHRNVGVVGSSMLFDELSTELICDLTHVSVPAVKLLVKNKPKDKVILVTDSIRAKGLADGVSELGGQQVFVKDGRATLKDGTLAGSTLKMNKAIENLVTRCGVPFNRAIDMATINPAKNLGVDSQMGSIAVGKNADFAVLDRRFNVVLTLRNGKIIHKIS